MKASNLVTLDIATGEIFESIAPPQNGGCKKCKRFTSGGRPVADYTTVLHFKNGEKRTYRCDNELKILLKQGMNFFRGCDELEACVFRFNEYAHECIKAYVFDNTEESKNDNVMLKSVGGVVTYTRISVIKVGTVLPCKLQK